MFVEVLLQMRDLAVEAPQFAGRFDLPADRIDLTLDPDLVVWAKPPSRRNWITCQQSWKKVFARTSASVFAMNSTASQ